MISSVVNLVLVVVVALVCAGLGGYLLRRANLFKGSIVETSALSLGLGLAVLVYSLAALGGLRLFYPGAAWIVVAVIGAVGFLSLRRLRIRAAEGFFVRVRSFSAIDWLLIVVIAIFGLGYLAVALTPTLDGDSLFGYLVLPREYARIHSLELVDHAYGATYPQNGQLLSTLGFLLRGQVLAQLMVVWLPGVLALATVYAFGRRLFSPRAGLLAATIWYGMYSVSFLAASAKIDLAWAAFDLLAVFSFARWHFAERRGRDWRWLVLAGIFLGVAGGTKHASVFTAIALSAAIFFRLWQDGNRRPVTWIGSLVALGGPASLAGIWVLRAYAIDEGSFFTGQGLANDSGVAGFFRTLWHMSMLGNAEITEGPAGKSIGPAILATVPLLVFIRGADKRVWHILAFCGVVLVMWYFGVQRARHLLPTLALLSVLAGYVVAVMLNDRPLLGRLAMALIVVSLGLNIGRWSYINLVSLQRVPYVVGLQGTDEYLAANLPKLGWYPNISLIKYVRQQVAKDARIAALSTGNGYYLDRPLLGRSPANASVGRNWTQTPEQIADPDYFAAELRAAAITHVFTNDYVIGIHNLQNAWLNQPAFQRDHLRRLICAEGQCLYAVLPTKGSVVNN